MKSNDTLNIINDFGEVGLEGRGGGGSNIRLSAPVKIQIFDKQYLFGRTFHVKSEKISFSFKVRLNHYFGLS